MTRRTGKTSSKYSVPGPAGSQKGRRNMHNPVTEWVGGPLTTRQQN